MSKKVVTQWLFIIACVSFGVTGLQAQKKVKYVYPKTSFDKAATQKALEKGRSTIRGSAYTKAFKEDHNLGEKGGGIGGAMAGGTKGAIAGTVGGAVVDQEAAKKLGSKKFAEKGTIVTLFPLTPYFEEYMKMREKSGFNIDSINPFGKKKVPAISEEAYEYKITTAVVDDKGNFEFKNLSPGRYLLEARVIYTKQGTAKRQIGTSTVTSVIGMTPGGPGVASAPIFGTSEVPVYEKYTVYWDKEAYVSEEVVIAEDGSVTTVNLN